MGTTKLEAPAELLEELLEERRRKGLDRWDEVWDGVYHMVPSPTEEHQRLALRLGAVLLPLVEARGLRIAQDLELHRPGTNRDDYKIPDLMVYAPPRGKVVEVAELVIEILSPGDETEKKLPWYASLPVREVLVLDPATRTPELHGPQGTSARGVVRSALLGVTFEAAPGPKLRVTWEGGQAEV